MKDEGFSAIFSNAINPWIICHCGKRYFFVRSFLTYIRSFLTYIRSFRTNIKRLLTMAALGVWASRPHLAFKVLLNDYSN